MHAFMSLCVNGVIAHRDRSRMHAYGMHTAYVSIRVCMTYTCMLYCDMVRIDTAAHFAVGGQ